MVTPVVAEISPSLARKQQREARALRASQSADYVPYRRRTAASTMRVATAVVQRTIR
jgi:hypothetical protein